MTRRLNLPAFPSGWHCYLLLCAGGSFYCGITSDLRTRLQDHASGKGTGFTKAHEPTALVWYEQHSDRHSAAGRERQIKGWSHAKKGELASGKLPFGTAGQSAWVPLG